MTTKIFGNVKTRQIITVLIFLVVSIQSYLSAQSFLFIVILALTFLLFILLFQIILWGVRRTHASFLKVRKTSFYVIYAVVLCLISWHGKLFVDRHIEADLQPAIELLDAYKVTHGVYPEKAADAVETMPGYYGSGIPAFYFARKSGTEFLLGCMTAPFETHEYASDQRRWEDGD